MALPREPTRQYHGPLYLPDQIAAHHEIEVVFHRGAARPGGERDPELVHTRTSKASLHQFRMAQNQSVGSAARCASSPVVDRGTACRTSRRRRRRGVNEEDWKRPDRCVGCNKLIASISADFASTSASSARSATAARLDFRSPPLPRPHLGGRPPHRWHGRLSGPRCCTRCAGATTDRSASGRTRRS